MKISSSSTSPSESVNVRDAIEDDSLDEVLKLIDLLESIDTSSPQAKLNETTISDNNGGRIEL
jgi:hypothetical protein